jgi:hypothetical protein
MSHRIVEPDVIEVLSESAAEMVPRKPAARAAPSDNRRSPRPGAGEPPG